MQTKMHRHEATKSAASYLQSLRSPLRTILIAACAFALASCGSSPGKIDPPGTSIRPKKAAVPSRLVRCIQKRTPIPAKDLDGEGSEKYVAQLETNDAAKTRCANELVRRLKGD